MMSIKEELFKSAAIEILVDEMKRVKIDIGNVEDTQAIKILEEIQSIIKSGKDDFEIVEEIVCVFEKYNIDAGICHDF